MEVRAHAAAATTAPFFKLVLSISQALDVNFVCNALLKPDELQFQNSLLNMNARAMDLLAFLIQEMFIGFDEKLRKTAAILEENGLQGAVESAEKYVFEDQSAKKDNDLKKCLLNKVYEYKNEPQSTILDMPSFLLHIFKQRQKKFLTYLHSLTKNPSLNEMQQDAIAVNLAKFNTLEDLIQFELRNPQIPLYLEKVENFRKQVVVEHQLEALERSFLSFEETLKLNETLVAIQLPIDDIQEIADIVTAYSFEKAKAYSPEVVSAITFLPKIHPIYTLSENDFEEFFQKNIVNKTQYLEEQFVRNNAPIYQTFGALALSATAYQMLLSIIIQIKDELAVKEARTSESQKDFREKLEMYQERFANYFQQLPRIGLPIIEMAEHLQAFRRRLEKVPVTKQLNTVMNTIDAALIDVERCQDLCKQKLISINSYIAFHDCIHELALALEESKEMKRYLFLSQDTTLLTAVHAFFQQNASVAFDQQANFIAIFEKLNAIFAIHQFDPTKNSKVYGGELLQKIYTRYLAEFEKHRPESTAPKLMGGSTSS